MRESENEICIAALKYFGIKNQAIKCVEELSELQKEICKMALGQGKREDITEEIADVEIMLEQMKIAVSIGFYEFNAIKSKKLHRLKKILESQPSEIRKTPERDFTEKELLDDAKCKQCLYVVMTEDELAKMDADPCDTCYDVRNWQPKES